MHSGLTSVAGLEKLTQLQALRLDNNQLTSVEGLEKLTQLQGLTLYNNPLTTIPRGLASLRSLSALFIDSAQQRALRSRLRSLAPGVVRVREG